MSKIRAAVFASGTGSNFEALVERDDLVCEIAFFVCDQPDAKVIEKASNYGIEAFVFWAKDFSSKEAYEQLLIEKLREKEIDWIFLAGYMRIVGHALLRAFEGKIINIHPSLLPDFPGKDAIGQAYEANVRETGVTIHFVDEGIDTGPIIAQETVPVYEDDTKETLKQRIQVVEHQLYPKTINQLLKKITSS